MFFHKGKQKNSQESQSRDLAILLLTQILLLTHSKLQIVH